MSISSNNPADFDQIYEEVFPLLLRITYHITSDIDAAEDLCQETFIRFYNRTLPFPSREQAKYWLIRVAKNLTFNYIKRKSREKKAMTKVKEEASVATNESGEVSLIKSESIKLVQRALEQLPEQLRAPLILKEYGGLNYKEIGKILKISEGNVKVRVFRARAQLAEIIDKGEVYVS